MNIKKLLSITNPTLADYDLLNDYLTAKVEHVKQLGTTKKFVDPTAVGFKKLVTELKKLYAKKAFHLPNPDLKAGAGQQKHFDFVQHILQAIANKKYHFDVKIFVNIYHNLQTLSGLFYDFKVLNKQQRLNDGAQGFEYNHIKNGTKNYYNGINYLIKQGLCYEIQQA